MEENVETIVNIEASAFVDFVDAPGVTMPHQSEEKNIIANYDKLENVPILPTDGVEYEGVKISSDRRADTYFIDVQEPAMYTVSVNPSLETVPTTRLIVFLAHDLNRPLIDGGLHNNSVRTFMHEARYRLVVHGVSGPYTVSVSRG